MLSHHKWMLDYEMLFLHLLRWWFYSSLCGRSHWLDVESSFCPWNKFHTHHLKWMILFMYFWIQFHVCWGFLSLCSSGILACSFLFLWHLCLVLLLKSNMANIRFTWRPCWSTDVGIHSTHFGFHRIQVEPDTLHFS